MSAPIWEELGHDDRKDLASLFQYHCPLPNEGLSSRFYAALIAVANVGYQRARDHVACELGESWGEGK